MTLYDKFICKAKERIALRHLTLTVVGAAIGLSTAQVSRVLNGVFRIKGDSLLRMAMILDISLDEITGVTRQPSEKAISFKAWKPFRPGELPTDGILLDEEKRLTANLYEHKVPFIHPCSICGQWHTCPNAYTTDAELCKEHEGVR